MIASLSGRRRFERLRACGVRRGKGPITVISRHRVGQEPRLAFAISRGVGNSVRRTRTRRRIRHVFAELCASRGAELCGDHLIRVHAPIEHWSHGRLVDAMAELLATTGRSAVSPAGNRTRDRLAAGPGEARQ